MEEGRSAAEDIDIPPYFICPISLQIMRDPVILCTGITYDRHSIEQWLFSTSNKAHPTCPVTKQPLADTQLTPNATLSRLIQSWCAANASSGVPTIPTPTAPIDKAGMTRLIEDARNARSPPAQIRALRKLLDLAADSGRNRRCAEDAGAADVLVTIVKDGVDKPRPAGSESMASSVESASTPTPAPAASSDEYSLAILHALRISDQGLRDLIAKHDDLIDLLTSVLRGSNDQSRTYALFLLKSLSESLPPVRLMAAPHSLFSELVRAIRDRISYRATKASLRSLKELCPWGRNRIRAAEAGVVGALIEVLLEGPENRVCEMVLVVLELLCGCAEGRQAMAGHGAGLAVVSRTVLRVSPLATERAVRVLSWVCKYAATPGVVQEMAQVGAVARLCMAIREESGTTEKTKEKAREVLRMHARVWRNSPCVPPKLLASYPS